MANSTPDGEMLRIERFVVDVLRGIVESALRSGLTPATVLQLYVEAAEEAFESLPIVPTPGLTGRARREEARNLKGLLERRAALKACVIVTAAGAAMTPEAVAELLETNFASVMKAKDEGRLIAYKHPLTGVALFPVFQFEGKGIAPWVPELIAIFGNGIAALHFLTVERKSLKGCNFLSKIQAAKTAKQRVAAISGMLKVARICLP